MLEKKDSACRDFKKALELGIKTAQKKIDKCEDTAKSALAIHSILRLTKTSTNEKYGFTMEMPVKAGTGHDGALINERAYLNLLRDAKGKPVQYKWIESCCAYDTPNSYYKKGFLDKYEIIYFDAKGKKKKSFVYLTSYDYEEPEILMGFGTVGR